MTKEEIKATISMPDLLIRNGILLNRKGYINCPFHTEKTASMKIHHDYFYCFGCGASGDIFDMEMHLNNCDFKTAHELLGGGEKPSWRATVAANKARRARIEAEQKKRDYEIELRNIQMHITAYRNLILMTEPFSDLWCYCQNKLQYQIYLLEKLLELGK